MTLYPPSNWVESTVPAEAGGCGQTHRRPYVSGAPVHPYGLECPPCEDFLRKNMPGQWSATISEIPETYDETKAREDFDRRGAKDKDALMTLIMARAVGIDPSQLPESLTRMVSGKPLHVPGQLECPQGHAQPAGQKFCGECGSPMSSPAAKAALNGPQRAPEPPPPAPSPPAGPKYAKLREADKDTLKALARQHGLMDDGTRTDLIIRLSNAGVTNADLRRFQEAALAA